MRTKEEGNKMKICPLLKKACIESRCIGYEIREKTKKNLKQIIVEGAIIVAVPYCRILKMPLE